MAKNPTKVRADSMGSVEHYEYYAYNAKDLKAGRVDMAESRFTNVN